MKVEKIILIDADVISHFFVGGYILLLPKIFPFKIKILDKVYKELEKTPGRRADVQNLINMKLFEAISFPEDDEQIKREYLRLRDKEFKGDGESACMAVARFSENILASSNLKDIKDYCITHRITYLTTMDFLCHALNTKLMSIKECNEFLSRTKAAKQRLPFGKMEDHQCRKILY